MSLKLTTSLSQRLVLTPQLRQRIEMLQMTTLELGELIQQQLLENPVLEEVATQEEARELAEKILDHLASADEGSSFDKPAGATAEADPGAISSNGTGELDASIASDAEREFETPGDSLEGAGTAEAAGDVGGDDSPGDETSRDAFEEIDFGREFQDYLDPGYKTQEYEYKEDAPTFEQFLTKAQSLSEHLEWQMHMDPISEEVQDAAVCVIGNLDADGRLT